MKKKRNQDLISIKYQNFHVNFVVLKVFKFSSERKMMSVLVQRCSDDKIILYSKGADSSILPRLICN